MQREIYLIRKSNQMITTFPQHSTAEDNMSSGPGIPLKG